VHCGKVVPHSISRHRISFGKGGGEMIRKAYIPPPQSCIQNLFNMGVLPVDLGEENGLEKKKIYVEGLLRTSVYE